MTAPTAAPAPDAPDAPDAPGRARPGPGRFVVPAVLAAVALAVVAVVAWPGGSGDSPDLLVSDLAAGEGTDVAAVYLTIANQGGDDQLLGATSPAASTVVLHDTSADGAMSASRPAPVTGDRPLALRPGGAHLMLEGLRQPLVPGQTVPLTLRFERAGELDLTARVVAYQDVSTLTFGEGGR